MKITSSTPIVTKYTAEMTREELLFILIAVGRTSGMNGGLSDRLYYTLHTAAAYAQGEVNAREELGVEVSGGTQINLRSLRR